MISAVLFDKDGTLFDFQVSWSGWARAFLADLTGGDGARAAALGGRIGFDWAAGGFQPDSCVIAGTDSDIIAALLPVLPEHDDAGLRRRIGLAAAAAPMAEAVPLAPFLDALSARGLRVGVATNDSEFAARAHLERAGIHDRFDFIAGADSGHGPKPGPGMCMARRRWSCTACSGWRGRVCVGGVPPMSTASACSAISSSSSARALSRASISRQRVRESFNSASPL